jgi:hypothetical protein
VAGFSVQLPPSVAPPALEMKSALLLLIPLVSFAATEPRDHDNEGVGNVFPKPDPAQAFAEMKLLSADGAVWRKPLEDWAGARHRLAADPAWAQWFAAQRAEVDDWMARQHDRVEWVGGWWHDFVSPKDGSFLLWTSAVPGEEAKFLSSASDPRVEVTPKIFRAWVGIFRGRNITMVDRAAVLWRLTGDPRYARWAAEQLDFYANNLERWPIQDLFYGPSRLRVQPLDDAIDLTKLTRTIRLIWDGTTPARRQFWFDRLLRPEAEMLDESMHRIHNIGCWLRSATAQVALLYGDDALWRFAIDGPWGLRQQLSHGVTSDYFWYEQSLGYQEFIAAALIPLFTETALAGRGPELAREMAIVENLILAPTWLRFPNGSLPNPADNTVSYPRYAPLTDTLVRAYRILPTPLGLTQAGKIKSWDTLLDPPPETPVKSPPLPAVTSHNFESSRFAILRAGDWQVFFHYGQLTGSHAQAEALNFEACYGDTDITHDPCTVGYGSPLHRGYYTRGLTHNVPLLNGEGEEPPQPGELITFDAGRATIAAAQPAYRSDARAQRTLRIVGQRLIDEATITALAGSPQTLGLALHVQGHVALPAQFLPVADFASGRPEPFRYWRDVRSATYHDQAGFDLAYPNGLTVHLTFALPGEFRVFHGSAPDSPAPARREAFYLETHGVKATFTTEMLAGERSP